MQTEATRRAWVALAAILVLAAAAYPLLASKGKIGLRFSDLPLSMDGMQYMDFAQFEDNGKDLNLPADAKAIRWMQDTVVGTPVVLEGRSPVYRWGSRFSIYTGLPTILGWDVHQSQQRSGYASMIQERIVDVDDERQHLVLHFDRRDGIVGQIFGLGRDDRDHFALQVDFARQWSGDKAIAVGARDGQSRRVLNDGRNRRVHIRQDVRHPGHLFGN